MTKQGVLLYGANGYTGRLILDVALRQGLRPTLGGRRKEALEPLAAPHGLPVRAFPLDDPARVAEELAPFQALLLAAGPFSKTSRPAFEACLLAKTAYLDITGEIDVFEALFARRDEAIRAGIPVLPGVGFDVVPSDCLAASLAAACPGAVKLELALRGAKVSAGTMKTMIEGLPKGGRIRRDGALTTVPAAYKTQEIPFADKPRLAMTIPWGDVSTAYYSTGIPSIEVYMAVPKAAIAAARRTRFLAPLLGLPPVQAFLKARAGRRIAGPTEEDRRHERSFLWGRVTAQDGRTVEGTLTTLEGYALTAETAIAAVAKVLAGQVPPGVFTPSMAFGAGFVESVHETAMRIGKSG